MVTSVKTKNTLYKSNVYRSEISRAWYPTNIECCVSVGKVSQLRRSLLLKSQVLHMLLASRRAHLGKLFHRIGQQLNGTPMEHASMLPTMPTMVELPVTPRVRVLETIDLSASDIEHFLAEDTIVPVTPKLSALAPIQLIEASSHESPV